MILCVKIISPNFQMQLLMFFIKGNLILLFLKNFTNVNQIIRLPKKHFDELGKLYEGLVETGKNKYDLTINADKNSSSDVCLFSFVNANSNVLGTSN